MEANPKAEALSNLQYTAEEMYQTIESVCDFILDEPEEYADQVENIRDLIEQMEGAISEFRRVFPSEWDKKLKEVSLKARHGDDEAAIELMKMLSGKTS
jgi:hypothetical protein